MFREGHPVPMQPLPNSTQGLATGDSLTLIGRPVRTSLGPGTIRFVGFVQHTNPKKYVAHDRVS